MAEHETQSNESLVDSEIKALGDDDVAVRMAAAWNLGEIKDPRAIKPLIRALEGRNWHVRVNAAWALASFKDRRTVQPLIRALEDRDFHVRRIVVPYCTLLKTHGLLN